ncbi:MAG: PKD domain-containing protein [bacterium]|nr:PKD domain-containing protein [bacterium]
MKLKLYILTLICYFYQSNIYSQTSKYWGDRIPYEIGEFENSSEIKAYQYLPQISFGRGGAFVYSSFNGDLMFLGGTNRVFDNNGLPIQNSDKLFIPNFGVSLQTDDNRWEALGFHYYDTTKNTGPFQTIKLDMNLYCAYNNCFDSFQYYPFGFYKTELKRDSNNIGYVSDKMQSKYFNVHVKRIQFTDVRRTFDYNYQLLGARPMLPIKKNQTNSVGLYHFSYQHNDLRILDSFIFDAYDYLPDSIKIPMPNIEIFINWPHLSRNRDKVFVNISILADYKIYIQSGYRKEMLFEINVDPLTGKFIGRPTILFEDGNTDQIFKPSKNAVSYRFYSGGGPRDAFSPNDSIIYLQYLERKIVKGITKEIYQKILAWKFRQEPVQKAQPIFTKTDLNSETSKWLMQTGDVNPYGGFTVGYREYANQNDFTHFSDANAPFTSITKQQSFPNNYTLGNFNAPLLHNYDYLRIKDSIVYKDCGAYAFIKNKSDVSNGLSDFKWYVAKNTKWTQWDSFTTVDLPTQFFTKSGKYLFKLHGTSTRGSGYKEWYVDTIIIKIPPKPVASFYAKDSIVCRYTGLQFKNYSYAKDTQRNDFLWSFGDGNTSIAKNPLYTYTKPGIYTVSLFYRNGYCDSTLVKNQYIKVVDAPRPGFSVVSEQGCAPFNAQFTDTVVLNVKQKDYYFSDTKLWQNYSITAPNFSHIFTKAGVYRAVQRLTGFTGCVIQTDSVFFHISKGLTNMDTLDIINSTIQNKNAFLFWGKQDAAVRYQLYKDGNPYIQTKDSFYNEQTEYTKDAVYTVAGIDSCGNNSIIGRLGKPMFLKGNIIGNNEASIIYFTPYLQWKGTDIIYRIQKQINGNWLTVNSDKVNMTYNDLQFLNRSDLQTCYRIEAFENSQPTLLSHSNEICIPYIPTIFVPTAFSPNDDAINDIYEPVTFGVSTYSLTVVNRWGEIIYKGNDNQAWNGNNAPEGVFTILISYTTNTGLKLNQRVTVTLMK